MKLLFISEFFPTTVEGDITGGIESRLFYITRILAKRHTVYVIAARAKDNPDFQELMGVKIYRVGYEQSYTRTGEAIKRLLYVVFAVVKAIQLDFDVVEGSSFFGWLPAWISGSLKRRVKVLLVADVLRDYGVAISKPTFKLLKFFEQFIFKLHWNLIITISETVRTKVLAYGMSKNNVITIYCGIDLNLLSTVRIGKSSKPIICCVARLVPYKRVIDLLSAALLVSRKIKNLQIDIVGNGEELLNLKKFSREHKQLKIYFHKFIIDHKNMLKLVKRAQIFCLPSIVEGFGIATIEALALGTPAVIANIAINREVTKSKGVRYFKPKDINSLALQLRILLTEKHLQKRLAKEGQEVAKLYDMQKIAQQTESIYENLCTH